MQYWELLCEGTFAKFGLVGSASHLPKQQAAIVSRMYLPKIMLYVIRPPFYMDDTSPSLGCNSNLSRYSNNSPPPPPPPPAPLELILHLGDSETRKSITREVQLLSPWLQRCKMKARHLAGSAPFEEENAKKQERPHEYSQTFPLWVALCLFHIGTNNDVQREQQSSILFSREGGRSSRAPCDTLVVWREASIWQFPLCVSCCLKCNSFSYSPVCFCEEVTEFLILSPHNCRDGDYILYLVLTVCMIKSKWKRAPSYVKSSMSIKQLSHTEKNPAQSFHGWLFFYVACCNVLLLLHNVLHLENCGECTKRHTRGNGSGRKEGNL